jgi:hypothetical protein
MPRFYFHLRDGQNSHRPDDMGVDFPDVEAAYLEAFQAAKDMAQEWLTKGQNPRAYAFEIMDVSGRLVLELPFSEVLDRQSGRHPAMLSRSIRVAKEQGERMMRLTAEVTQQVRATQENLRHSQELLKSLGSNSAD